MRQECIEAVSRAANRTLTQAEIKGIEDRIKSNLRQLAVKDRTAFLGMSDAARLQEAARLASEQMVAEAVKKKQRIAKQIQVHDMLENYIDSRVAKGESALKALKRTLAFDPDGKSNFESVESKANGVFYDAMANLTDMFEQGKGAFFGLIQDRAGVEAIVRELHGQDSGVPSAKQAAKAFQDTAEALRRQFNDAGGNIGKLEDWAMPQHHAQDLVYKAGRDGWVAAVEGKLNRSKYVNADGSLMTDAQLTEFLGKAWESIAWGGINKIEPGKITGSGMRANSGSEHRQIHFKDADSYMAYQEQFGDKSLYDTIVGHMKAVSKDIALVEKFGPNPNLTFEFFRDKALKSSVENGLAPGKAQAESSRVTGLYDFVAGRTPPVANEAMAATFDTLRNWMVASRLGSAVIGSLADEGTLVVTAKINNLPVTQVWRNELAAMNLSNQAELRMARRAGLAWESAISGMNRWGQDNLGPGMAAKLANTTIKMSGLSAITDVRKRAFGVTMMDAIGHLAKTKEFSALDADDNRILLSKGITETQWAVWRLAETERWNGTNTTMLTPQAIYAIPDEALAGFGNPEALRRDAAQKLVAAVMEEVDMAVVTPGAADRFALQFGSQAQRGTFGGELIRSLVLFKSFPWAMIARHWGRGLSMETSTGKAAYIASFVGATAIMGTVALEIDELLNGRDPKSLNPNDKNAWKTGLKGLLKGGGMGLYGDFLFSEATQHNRNGILSSMLGPIAGGVESAMGLTQGNLVQMANGQKTNFGAEAAQFVRSNTPFANLWYAKAALDHLIFQRLQEELSPGYNAKVQQRAQREFGQDYWWRPGQVEPDRGPAIERIAGQ